MKVLLAQINPTIGDIEGNCAKVLQAIKRAKNKNASLLLFPELTLTGYFPDDLLLDHALIQKAEEKLNQMAPMTEGMMVVIGLPRKSEKGTEKPLYNSAAICMDGKVVGFQDKVLLPTYDVFDERRYFESGKAHPIWEYRGLKIAITICEDLWQHARAISETDYEVDPVKEFEGRGVDLLFNLSGSPYSFRRKERRVSIFREVVKTLSCPLFFCNQVGANDQLIFDGHSFVLRADGEVALMGRGFVEEDLLIDLEKDLPQRKMIEDEGIADLYQALVLGVRDYFHKQGFQKAILGLSGGIDSALVAAIACEALGKEQVIALSLPSRYNAPTSLSDAKLLAQNLGLAFQVVSIDPIFQQYLDLFTSLFGKAPSDMTQQNLQARIRGMILMAFSNEHGLILLNTSNKSEMAFGYATLYGDMAGGLGVLQDVTKGKIYRLAHFVNREKEVIPISIIQKIPSAELTENQTDFDTLPPYEVLDPVVDGYLENGDSLEALQKELGLSFSFLQDLILKIHRSEYKRRQAPIGLRVTEKAFGKGRIVPIVQKWR
ncbi:MAG TPA: NAD+ synthase [Chlamydiales bacterium]|nr:NAD+ synthase [Chlamydiales bacterium]